MGVADPSEDDGASQAVCRYAEERLQLDQEQNEPRIPSGMDAPGHCPNKACGAYAEPTKDLDRWHRAIGHGPKEEW